MLRTVVGIRMTAFPTKASVRRGASSRLESSVRRRCLRRPRRSHRRPTRLLRPPLTIASVWQASVLRTVVASLRVWSRVSVLTMQLSQRAAIRVPTLVRRALLRVVRDWYSHVRATR